MLLNKPAFRTELLTSRQESVKVIGQQAFLTNEDASHVPEVLLVG